VAGFASANLSGDELLLPMETDLGQLRMHIRDDLHRVIVGSLARSWILEEIGVPYELNVVNLRRGANKRDDYLKI